MRTPARERSIEDAGHGSTVLVVEDDEATRYAVSRTLGRAGLNVLTAVTGPDGYAAARELSPDLVLLDIGLPQMNGFEVCAALKGDPRTRRIPVVFLSASHVSVLDTVRGLDGGADLYLSHPVEPTVLVAAVRALLRARRSEDERERALWRESEARRIAEDARERLASALRGREDALANVVHDLRSPLQTVELGARYLERALPASAELDAARRQVAAIQRASGQMAALVANLLDFAKLQAGQLLLHLGRVDVGAIVDETFEAHRLSAEEREVALSCARPDGLRALVDATRIQQVLANLVANAVKFTPRGGRVEIGARQEATSALFWVADTGPGMPPEQLTRAFDRFWQARDGAAGGAGLGLAIAKGIVEAHGGRIWIESDPGAGTRVSFTVARSDAAAA